MAWWQIFITIGFIILFIGLLASYTPDWINNIQRKKEKKKL